ncbi:tyrosine-protein phosphatase [Flavobacterium sp. MC2016-06]|uniref:tyrosine-protein phosphatase n=1 Tax=Flavobacterium sp. MC2016-06 TaxID=2676308 RepID=UPI0012BAB903|nr:tyrosine-protein phosphatase [Flavobacterium sp. MC2016-06]MBU3862325.1 tyrosine-protein phosphatase [Flavobacterium sp. MC2016-06]
MKKIIITMAILGSMVSYGQLTDSIKRLVPVKGALNFRDVGGYKTNDGKQVLWDKVYRSAAINKLTDEDVALLDKKGIHTIVDFRGVAEAAAAPDRLPKNSDYTLSPAGSDSLPNPAQMVKFLKEGNFLEKFYGVDAVKYSGDRFRPLFIKLLTLDKKEAIMYHCTGGRDRTGMATALFLYILNVPQETIEADYVASNIYLRKMNKGMMAPLAKMSGLTEEQVEKEMALRPELIRSFFDGLKKQYGSIENFLQQEIGIGPKEIAILRKKYTA